MRRTSLMAHGVAAVLGLALLAGEAHAASDGATLATDQVTIRLTRETAMPDGTVRGALVVDLAPGWKTYWIDPGASGIPPTIDFSRTRGLGGATLRFPAPHRLGEDFSRANGYKQPISIAFELAPKPQAAIGPVEAQILLGVCAEICIPVQANLTGGSDAAVDAPVVAAAFSALPDRSGDIGRIRSAVADGTGDWLTITAEYAGAAEAPDLFVRGPEGWYFGEPAAPTSQADDLVFRVEVVDRPPGAEGAPETIDVVFTDGPRAFEANDIVVLDNPSQG
ncbi:protein-disulfide reductase DsbD domain-containing protein [Aurantimonas marina]|uniref:protein-disulfide reductase DsbD domain-containing protein n=1 Tax=Aurantimonas marina TaxID=2780508 RepID=UPI0019D0EA07|nr:protein-disulfide reductase DsbD domain-containing protein [Aurantimonas marina]